MTALNSDKIRKILLIKLKGIGDVVLSTIVFDSLRAAFPLAKIDYLTEPPSGPLLEPIPFINKVILFRKKDPLGSLKLIWEVISGGYDLVLDMYANPRTALVTFLSGAKYRAGFPYRGRAYAYNLPGPVERGGMHAALLHIELLKYMGVPIGRQNLFFGLTEKDVAFADGFFSKYFSGNQPVLAISPSGGWESKKCPPDRFIEFAVEILHSYVMKVLVVWGPGDREDAEQIAGALGEKAVLAPASSIREMGALMRRCTAVLANDSGPMHIAAALDVPVLSIHGPTIPQYQGAFGDKNLFVRLDELDCIGCNLLVCPIEHQCFRDLPATRVLKKFTELVFINNLNIPEHEKKA